MGEAEAAPVRVLPREEERAPPATGEARRPQHPVDVPLLEGRGLHKSYWLGEKEIHVLRGASFALAPGEMASLVGPSGVGKSTFLHVVGTLDPPTAGQVLYDGEDAFAMGEEPLARFRNRNIGFVFQFHYLLPEFTALENTAMPALIGRMPRPEAEAVARQMLELVGLGHRMDHKPGELSGGEQQRVALARALVLKPRLLLADEPTGNLDEATGEGIHQLLVDLNQRLGIAAIVVTHNPRLAERMPRRLRLSDGLVVEADAAAT
jgi:lipoprotein-releasing system ATP-binding protein